MQVSLRKANALQVAVNEALKGLELKTDVSINEFQSPSKEIDAAAARFTKNLSRRNSLIAALYEIRAKVSTANSTNGVDALLNTLARLEKDAIFFGGFAKANERTDIEVIKGKLAKISNRTEDSYYTKAEVETSIFTADEIESFRSTAALIKKQKQKIQDELLELNVRVTIELSDQAIEILKSEDII